MNTKHLKKLENMYLNANINTQTFDSTTAKFSEQEAEIGLSIDPKYFHAMQAIHGSVYFKLLDDATFFAVQSIVEDVAVLTTSFNLNIIRPANKGKIKAVGKLKFQSKNLFVAEATLYNEEEKVIAFGTGNFAKSKVSLAETPGYC